MNADTAPKKQGRPKGSRSIVTSKARQAAMATGLLPHEWLLKVARGEMVQQQIPTRDVETGVVTYELREVYPDLETRLDAAKAAAPFYAPKLATQNVNMKGSLGVGVLDAESLKKMSLKELDVMIALLGKALGSFNGDDD